MLVNVQWNRYSQTHVTGIQIMILEEHCISYRILVVALVVTYMPCLSTEQTSALQQSIYIVSAYYYDQANQYYKPYYMD